jgi:hypothetical protein
VSCTPLVAVACSPHPPPNPSMEAEVAPNISYCSVPYSAPLHLHISDDKVEVGNSACPSEIRCRWSRAEETVPLGLDSRWVSWVDVTRPHRGGIGTVGNRAAVLPSSSELGGDEAKSSANCDLPKEVAKVVHDHAKHYDWTVLFFSPPPCLFHTRCGIIKLL